MKSIFFCLSLFAILSNSIAQVKIPQASSTQTIKQDFGTAFIELTYSRPNLKGRTIIGEQDPWDKVWRTGANAATKLKFLEPVTIGGKLLDTGTYILYTIPHKNADWDIIINKGINNWGSDGYKESEDIVRFKAPLIKTKKENIETFTIQFANVKYESLDLQILWNDWSISFPITVNIKEKLRAKIEAAMLTDKKPYWTAANFYFEWDKDYTKALENTNKAIEGNPKGFYMYLLKAKALKNLNKKDEAKIAATKCIELATTEKNEAYIKQGNDFLKIL